MSARWRALITGITGQDGAYLAELLLERDDLSLAQRGALMRERGFRAVQGRE